MDTLVENYLCPGCGHWYDSLVEVTGKCADCSPGYCIRCGSQFSQTDKYRKLCWSCRDESYLAKYADQLETLILQGYSLDECRQLISRDYQPRCSSCGEVIRMGRRGESLFCTKYEKCRTAKRRYRTLKKRYKEDVFAYVHVVIEIQIREIYDIRVRSGAS